MTDITTNGAMFPATVGSQTTEEQALTNRLARGCPKHKEYKGLLPPKATCKYCEEIYFNKNNKKT